MNLLKITLTETENRNRGFRLRLWVVTEPVTVTETDFKTDETAVINRRNRNREALLCSEVIRFVAWHFKSISECKLLFLKDK